MHSKQHFANRLKELRGKTPVKILAKETGLSATALYKAEAGEDSVSWKTIESGYGDLCLHPSQYEELLMLWAITQSERKVSLYVAREALNNVILEEAKTMSKDNTQVMREMEMMNAADQRLFARFSRLFRVNEPTRKMSKSWIEHLDEVTKMG